MRYLGVTIISPHKGPNTTSRVAQLCWTCPADSMLGIREEFGDGIWTRSILLSYPAHHHIILYIICIYFSVVFIDTWMDVYFTIQWYAGHRAQNRCIYSLKRHWGWSSPMLDVWGFCLSFGPPSGSPQGLLLTVLRDHFWLGFGDCMWCQE